MQLAHVLQLLLMLLLLLLADIVIFRIMPMGLVCYIIDPQALIMLNQPKHCHHHCLVQLTFSHIDAPSAGAIQTDSYWLGYLWLV